MGTVMPKGDFKKLVIPKDTPLARKKSTATAVGYVRMSTDDQQLSIPAQKAAIAEWSKKNGISVLHTYEDPGVSGAVPVFERAGLMNALTHVEEAEADWLIVSQRDRVARDVLQMLLLERSLQRIKAGLLTCIDDPSAEKTEEGRLLSVILDAFSQYELAQTRRRTKRALAARKAMGLRTGGPRGYAGSPEGAKIALMVWDLRDKGWGYRRIVSHLNGTGVKTLQGFRWHVPGIKNILKVTREEYQKQLSRSDLEKLKGRENVD